MYTINVAGKNLNYQWELYVPENVDADKYIKEWLKAEYGIDDTYYITYAKMSQTEILLNETDVSQFKDKIVNIAWRLVDSWIGYIVLTTNVELSDKELEIISDWVDTQNSDGLGEGFSGQDFAFDEENEEYAGITTYYVKSKEDSHAFKKLY